MVVVNVPPVAADGVMANGLLDTFANAFAPALVSVTLPIVSLFCKPLEVNALELNVDVSPYILLKLFAVIVNGACVILNAVVLLAA